MAANAQSRRDDERLARRYRGGDRRARQTLIERYLPLARSLAKRYHRASEPLDDLVQVASIGLIKAVDRWDPDRGFTFSTYAVPTIIGELRRHFRDATWALRPPRDLLELTLAVEKARQSLSATGREPSAAALAARLGESTEAVVEALQAARTRSIHSLDRPAHIDGEASATVGELTGQEDGGYERAEARTTIEQMTSMLDNRAREMLRLRFDHDLLQTEIAARVGCSQMHVSRVIRDSLEKLAVLGSEQRCA
jgi:RNA polymerase sigma-B factor